MERGEVPDTAFVAGVYQLMWAILVSDRNVLLSSLGLSPYKRKLCLNITSPQSAVV